MLQGLIIGARRHGRGATLGLGAVVRARSLQADPRADRRLPDVATCRSGAAARLRAWSSCAARARSASSRRSIRRARPRGSIRRRRCDHEHDRELASDASQARGSIARFVEAVPTLRQVATRTPVGAHADRAARSRSARSSAARWWRSSARRASARARCCTCSAGSIAPTQGTVAHRRRASSTALPDAGARRVPQPARRLRLPVPPPAAGVHRARERRDADADRAACRPAEARPRAEALLRARRAGRAARRTGRACCRAASSSAWRWRARWSCGRRCCWPTSRPATSTSTPPTRCTRCCARCTATHGLTSVIATHNPRLAAACDRVLRLEGGAAASGRRSHAGPPAALRTASERQMLGREP